MGDRAVCYDKPWEDLTPDEKATEMTSRALGELKRKPWSWRGWAALILTAWARLVLWRAGAP